MAEVTSVERGQPNARAERLRSYPPLLAMVIALVLALVVLPSSLNLPQTNPTQTLEFAPVPPDDEQPADDQGNTSSLGLGSSSNVEGDGADGEGPGAPPPPPETGGRVDIGTQCVGNPPRQTFDPLSPPCVPFWDLEQDNGGDTYQGVTRNEVRIVFYTDGNIDYINASDSGNRNAPSGQLYDLALDAETCRNTRAESKPGCDHLVTRALRTWQEYFNKRFQTYGRNVHMWLMFGRGRIDPERKADAAEIFGKIRPFAVVSNAQGAEDTFLRAMAQKGVLNFGSFGVRENAFFNQYPGMIWGVLPSVENLVRQYGSYVCTQVIPHPAAMADVTMNGQSRKLGMVHTSDNNWPSLIELARQVTAHVEGCGGVIVDTATFDGCCLARRGGSVSPAASDKMAAFRNQGITTILWTGGLNGEYAKAAASIGYYPEWIVLGDSQMDGHWPITLSDSSPSFDGHAVLVTPQPLQPALQQQICAVAFREVDKNYANPDLLYTCNYYRDLFQTFSAIQVAGPYLGPTQINKGFRAIPQRYFGEAQVPACFYPAGDHTCYKDATAMYWDADQTAPGDNRPGCWRAIEEGLRYAPGTWPNENINARILGNEPCTGYDARALFSYTP